MSTAPRNARRGLAATTSTPEAMLMAGITAREERPTADCSPEAIGMRLIRRTEIVGTIAVGQLQTSLSAIQTGRGYPAYFRRDFAQTPVNLIDDSLRGAWRDIDAHQFASIVPGRNTDFHVSIQAVEGFLLVSIRKAYHIQLWFRKC